MPTLAGAVHLLGLTNESHFACATAARVAAWQGQQTTLAQPGAGWAWQWLRVSFGMFGRCKNSPFEN
jgi:hypothetical protein